MKGVYHEKLADILAGEAGISVRSGCFCAHPYVQKLMKVEPAILSAAADHLPENRPGMVRVSFGLYNEPHEVGRLLEVLQEIAKDRRRYLKMYS